MKKEEIKMKLVNLIDLYIHKNYFLNFRKQFLEILKHVGPKEGIDINYERKVETHNNYLCDHYTLFIDGIQLETKEYGEPFVKKGRISKDNLRRLIKIITSSETFLLGMISDELKKYPLEPFVIYAALMEAMNNFRFKVDHLKTFLKETVEVKGNNLIIKDKKGTLSFKLIKKLSPKDLWKAYHSFGMSKYAKILDYGPPEKFMLGRPFIFVLKEEDVSYEGKVKNILKDIRKLLSIYFSNFIVMNMYEINLDVEKRSWLDIVLVRASEKFMEAAFIMNRNVRRKLNVLVTDEEKDWLLGILNELVEKKELGWTRPLLNAVKESRLILKMKV